MRKVRFRAVECLAKVTQIGLLPWASNVVAGASALLVTLLQQARGPEPDCRGQVGG
jgi:hypothetical protein